MTMSGRIQSLDWTKTSIGSMERWPQSLKATIKTLLGSRYPMILLWGESLIQIYNDAYTGLIGDKHPYALGRSIKETQAESWDTIGPMINHVMSTGIPNWVPAQLLAVNRSGFNEETYFSLSYSAVENDENVITGMLCVCSEVTQQVVGERRLRLQRDLSSKAGEIRSMDKVCMDIASAIKDYPTDVPFILLYLKDGDNNLRLCSIVGIEEPINTLFSNPDKNGNDPWSLRLALTGTTILTDDVPSIVSLQPGLWNELIKKALTLPIPSSSPTHPLGVLVAGISPNALWDDNYRSFYDLLSSQLSVSLRNAMAYEEERKRAEALAEIDRAKTAFFSNVSHEFRTPLTLMLGPLEEVIERKNSSLVEEDRAQLSIVYQNSLRLLKLVNSLLDFSRIEANRVQALYTPIDLGVFTAELASSFESAIKKAGIEYRVDCSDTSEPVYIDQEMWEKIVFNLVSNALKFTFEGTISVVLKEEEKNVLLIIKDTGVGISQEELPNIFKRFHRVQNTRSRSHEGTGIGLALVKELVHLHGGTITVSSTERKGTEFLVSIPKGFAHLDKDHVSTTKNIATRDVRGQSYINEALLWSEEERPPIESFSARVTPTNVQQDKNIMILVADDNVQMLQYLRRILEPHYKVETVKDGIEAIHFMRRNKPDIIVSDVMMPNMNGFELLAEIRKNTAWTNIPFILLSARAGKEATVEGLHKGANDYLVKPFYAEELLARVAAQLEIKLTRLDNIILERKVQARTVELEKINNELEQFASVASHDLQEPLRKIITFCSMLQNHIHDEDIAGRQYADKISHSAGRMKVLIADLLNFSRLSDTNVQFERTELNKIAKDVLSDFELLIAQKEAEITCGQLPVIDAVSLQMNQLFYNLLGNALKFTSRERKPRIHINIALLTRDEIEQYPAFNPNSRYIKIDFSDNGIGFTQVHAEQIFTIFNRLHNHSNFPGTGIGLALCKKIVLNHGGQIFAKGVENKGATITVILPEAQL